MKNGTILSLFALLISIVGLLIALLAYFKRRNCVLCDDLEDDLLEFYDEDDEAAEDGCNCQCDCGCEKPTATADTTPQASPEAEA